MKHNAFGDPILQAGDDVGAAFNEQFDTDPSDEMVARFIEEDSAVGWSCVIADSEDNELEVHDFPTEAALIDWLREKQIQVED